MSHFIQPLQHQYDLHFLCTIVPSLFSSTVLSPLLKKKCHIQNITLSIRSTIFKPYLPPPIHAFSFTNSSFSLKKKSFKNVIYPFLVFFSWLSLCLKYLYQINAISICLRSKANFPLELSAYTESPLCLQNGLQYQVRK